MSNHSGRLLKYLIWGLLLHVLTKVSCDSILDSAGVQPGLSGAGGVEAVPSPLVTPGDPTKTATSGPSGPIVADDHPGLSGADVSAVPSLVTTPGDPTKTAPENGRFDAILQNPTVEPELSAAEQKEVWNSAVDRGHAKFKAQLDSIDSGINWATDKVKTATDTGRAFGADSSLLDSVGAAATTLGTQAKTVTRAARILNDRTTADAKGVGERAVDFEGKTGLSVQDQVEGNIGPGSEILDLP